MCDQDTDCFELLLPSVEKNMRFEESKIGSVLVAKILESRISADVAASFKEDLINYITKGNHVLVLDMSQVTFIDSSGLGALIASLKIMGDDGELVLCGARDTVDSMFKLTRMNKVFRMFSSPEEAVSSLS
jgi:anti-sigma B factor antagonist